MGSDEPNPKFFSKEQRQMISLVVEGISQDFTLALKHATTFYFLLLHVTKLPPMMMQNPIVDHLSTLHLAQSTFIYIQ